MSTSNTTTRIFILVLTLLLLTLNGCAPPGNGEKDIPAISEEAYINLKHDFSLVIPGAWKLINLPVSVPEYKSDRVRWKIPSLAGTDGEFQVRHLLQPLAEENRGKFLHEQSGLPEGAATAFKHPAGSMLRLEGETRDKKIIFLLISNHSRSHLMTFSLDLPDYQRLNSTIEKIISSFRSLQNTESADE